MANVKVKTIGAVFNGQPIGSTIELSEVEAKHYEKLGYVEVIKEKPKATPKADEKGKSAPKKSASKSKPKSKDSK